MLFGRKHKDNYSIYKNLHGVPFADPNTRTIIGDFNDSQKQVLKTAIEYKYPASAVAYPEINSLCMERSLHAWKILQSYKATVTPLNTPADIQKSDIYSVALTFTKAIEKNSLLARGHAAWYGLDPDDNYTVEEDIENTMFHLYVLIGYGKNLLELMPHPLDMEKTDILYLSAGIQCGYDGVKGYVKNGTIKKDKIVQLCQKKLVRLACIPEQSKVDREIKGRLEYQSLVAQLGFDPLKKRHLL